jgi:hypothetical protein
VRSATRPAAANGAQAHLSEQLPVTVGEPHPASLLALRLSHEQLAKGLKAKLSGFVGRYDTARKCWVFPAALRFAIALPLTLTITGGDTITITSYDELFRHAVKYDPSSPSCCTCTRPRVGERTHAKRHEACETCSFRPDPERVVVQRAIGGGTCALKNALLLGERRTELLELLLAVLGSQESWPEYFAAGRCDPPAGATLPPHAGRSYAFSEPPEDGDLAGVDFAFGLRCTASGCGACVDGATRWWSTRCPRTRRRRRG